MNIDNNNNNNCLIGLCVYNNEPGLPSVLSNIVKISESKLFEKITVVAYYDSSFDNSYSIMEKFKSQYFNYNNDIEMIIINKCRQMRMDFGSVNRVLDKNRTTRIAIARNGILHYIRMQCATKDAHYKYFIMMDSNEYACVGKINIDALQSALNRSDEWDSVSFDREAGYYDYWALSCEPHIYSFYHVENRNEMLNNMVTSFATKLKNAKNVKDNKDEGPQYNFIPVYSAYNGFSIYKTDMFLNCSYGSEININLFPKHLLPSKILNNFKNDCEHRKFHLEAIKKNNARIMVSPLSIFYKLPIHNPGLRGPA